MLLLIAILVLTILPAFDLDPAHLRASRQALLLLVIMAVAVARAEIKHSLQFKPRAENSAHNKGPDLLDLKCARLC